MDDWEQDEEGNFKVHQLHAYQTATSPDWVLARIQYFIPDSDLPPNTPESVQLYMSPAMARKFGEHMIENADKFEKDGSDA